MSTEEGRSPAETGRPQDMGWGHWWAERLGLGASWREILYHPVPRKVSVTDYLGFLTLFAFANQVITGIVLTAFYHPTAAAAYQSVKAIQADPVLGFVRGLHYWGANAMMVLVGAHLLRVYFIGAYKRPREFQWLSGAFLLAVTLGLAFTGYLLPWDQQAFWATTVGTAMATYFPGIGPYLAHLARGGTWVTGATLSRFFAIHVLLLPMLLLLILGGHVLLVFVHGQSRVEEALPRGYRAKHRTGDLADFPKGDYRPFWPSTMAAMLGLVLVVAGVLAALALTHPAPLVAHADPLNRAHYRPVPVWYFDWIYQILKLFPGSLDVVGIVGLPLTAGFLLMALPFIDRNPFTAPRRRPFALGAAGAATAFILAFTYIGYTSASPLPTSVTAVAHPTFRGDIHPFLLKTCSQCHSASLRYGGFTIATYATIMKGGKIGRVVKPDHASESVIIKVLEGKAKNLPRMPLGQPAIPAGEIHTIANWINEGAPDN